MEAEANVIELERCISATIEEMNRSYRITDLNEEQLQERRLGDAKLHEMLCTLVRLLVRLRKLSECSMDSTHRRIGYDVRVGIDDLVFDYHVQHRSYDLKK